MREHLALVVSAAGAAFISMRLWAVSGYDFTTAVAVLNAQGAANVVFGTLLQLPLVVPTITLIGLYYGLKRYPLLNTKLLFVTLVLYIVLTGAFWPWPLATFGIIGTVTVVVIVTWTRKWVKAKIDEVPAMEQQYTIRAVKSMFQFMLVVAVINVLFIPIPWLPEENIETASGTTEVGYVLKAESSVLTVLADSPRKVVRLKVGNLADSREICEPRDGLQLILPALYVQEWYRQLLKRPSLLQLIAVDRSSYPPCR